MKRLIASGRFRKDFKKYRHDKEKLTAIKAVLEMLANEIPLPSEMRPHPLKGNFNGCMECHIGSDCLLIWMDPSGDCIKLVRLGSHSELFG